MVVVIARYSHERAPYRNTFREHRIISFTMTLPYHGFGNNAYKIGSLAHREILTTLRSAAQKYFFHKLHFCIPATHNCRVITLERTQSLSIYRSATEALKMRAATKDRITIAGLPNNLQEVSMKLVV